MDIAQRPVKDLRPHEGQIRSIYDIPALAELTMSMFVTGWDPLRPAEITLDGAIIAGHRRRMAFLMSCWLQETQPIDLSVVDDLNPLSLSAAQFAEFWTDAIKTFGDFDSVIDNLVAGYGNELVPCVIFEGDEVSALSRLQRDNFGSEVPDDLGIGRSLVFGVGLGISLSRQAMNMGKDYSWVYARYNLAILDQHSPSLAIKIRENELPITAATAIVSRLQKLPNRLAGVISFIDNHENLSLTLTTLRALANSIADWELPQVHLVSGTNQLQTNTARALSRAMAEIHQDQPVRFWSATAQMFVSSPDYMNDPWDSSNAVVAWLNALSIGDPSQHYSQRLHDHVDVRCEGCPFNELPRDHILQIDYGNGRIPCRTTANFEDDRCLRGYLPGELKEIPVNPIWADLDGVQIKDNKFFVPVDALLVAWQARRVVEETAATQPATSVKNDQEIAIDDEISTEPPETNHKQPTKESPKKPETKKKPAGKSPSTPAPSTKKTSPVEQKPEGPAELELYRASIATFMEESSKATVLDHPQVTSCSACAYKLPGSPVKGKEAPPCTWAASVRTIEFRRLEFGPNRVGFNCNQFQPEGDVSALIPTHPSPPDWPDEFYALTLSYISGNTNTNPNLRDTDTPYNRFVGRNISGRSMGNESLGTLFAKIGSQLSPGQKYTLFLVAIAYYHRSREATNPRAYYTTDPDDPTKLVKVTESVLHDKFVALARKAEVVG